MRCRCQQNDAHAAQLWCIAGNRGHSHVRSRYCVLRPADAEFVRTERNNGVLICNDDYATAERVYGRRVCVLLLMQSRQSRPLCVVNIERYL